MSEKSFRLWAFLTVVLSLGVRSFGLFREPWLDEIYTLFDSSLNLFRLTQGDHPPLLHVILGLLNPEDSVAVARLVMLAISLLTSLAFLWAMKPLGREGSLVGLVFLLGNPRIIVYATDIRMYGLLVLLTCLVLGELQRFQSGTPTFSGVLRLVGWLVLATQTHAVGIFLSTTALLVLLLFGKRSRPGPVLGGAILLIPLLSTLGWIWLYRMKDKLSNTSWIEYPAPGVIAEQTGYLLVDWKHSSAEAVIVLSLLLVSLCLCLSSGQGGKPYLAGGLFFYGQILLFSLLLKPIMLDRTLLPCLPFLAAFLAVRYQALLGRPRMSRAILALVIAYATYCSGQWVIYKNQICDTPFAEGLKPIANSIERKAYVVADWVLTPVPYFYFPDHPKEKIRIVNPHDPDLNKLPGQGTAYLILWNRKDGKTLEVRRRIGRGRSEKRIFQNSAIRVYLYPATEG